MEQIVIVGAGGFGREVKFIIDRINAAKPRFEIIGFYDDNASLPSHIHGVPYLGDIDNLIDAALTLGVVLGIGVPQIKKNLIERLAVNKNLFFPNIIDPVAIIGNDNISLGRGNVICAGVIATCDIVMHNFVTINLNCTVGHDTVLHDFSSFMPSVNISGEVIVEEGVYVGTGAKIINQITIGSSTIIGAGAVVSKSLPANCTAVGIPAKPIKFHD
jgi:sugar O-acyltransferase (sialic acid O-acetyltransferase NeuD family)